MLRFATVPRSIRASSRVPVPGYSLYAFARRSRAVAASAVAFDLVPRRTRVEGLTASSPIRLFNSVTIATPGGQPCDASAASLLRESTHASAHLAPAPTRHYAIYLRVYHTTRDTNSARAPHRRTAQLFAPTVDWACGVSSCVLASTSGRDHSKAHKCSSSNDRHLQIHKMPRQQRW